MWIISGFYLTSIAGLLVTIAIELLVAYLFRFRRSEELKVVALASVITYPILTVITTVIYYFFGAPFEKLSLSIIIIEFVIVFVEFYILYYVFQSKYSCKYLLLLAFTMNAASYIIGLFVF